MCQIIHSTEGRIPSDLGELLAKELQRNRNGAGVMAIMADSRLVVKQHWFKRKIQGWDNAFAIVKWLEARAKAGKIAQWAIHLRLATHGDKSTANCHPFEILAADSSKPPIGILMHNGVFDLEVKGKESDTALFAQACAGKSGAEVASLLAKHGNGSRLLTLMYGVDSKFQRLGSWTLGDNTTDLYFSSTPAMLKYMRVSSSSRLPYSNDWSGLGDHSSRKDFKSWGSSEVTQAEAIKQVHGDNTLVLLPETNGMLLKDSALPEGVKLNRDVVTRQAVVEQLDKHEEYRDLERLLIVAALGNDYRGFYPSDLLPTLDACAVYIGRLRSALGRLLHKQKASQYVIQGLRNQLAERAKAPPVDVDLQKDYREVVAELREVEGELKQADSQIDQLLCDVEVRDRMINSLALTVGADMVDHLEDKHTAEVIEEYPSYRPYTGKPEGSDSDELDGLFPEVDRVHYPTPDTLAPGSAIDKAVAERDTVKLPRELDTDTPPVDGEREALDSLGASIDGSFEG